MVKKIEEFDIRKMKIIMSLHLSIMKQNEEMKADQGSIENLCPGKTSDEPDRALQTSPLPVEGTGLPRRSPLIRNRKAGSMEVMRWTR